MRHRRLFQQDSRRPPKPNRGFTLVEALISSVVLAFAATTVIGLFHAGFMAMSAQTNRVELDNHMRSQMELLLSEKFNSPQLADGSKSITVNGTNHTLTWTVAGVDLDGDLADETDAKQITVTLGSKSLTTIVVDTDGLLGQI